MKKRVLRALRRYLVVTLVMCINVGLAAAAGWLLLPRGPRFRSWEQVPGLQVADGDRAVISQNLGWIDSLRLSGMHADLQVVLRYCGEPDGYAGDPSSDATLVYYCNRFGHRDWVTFVTLKEGRVVSIGYAPSEVNDLSGLRKWDVPGTDIPPRQ